MFEPVDFHRSAEVKNFFKFHINPSFFFSPQLDMFIDLYTFALVIKKEIFFSLNLAKNNGLQQHFNWWLSWSHIYCDWQGDETDWAIDGMFDRKSQTQMQEVYQILLQWSCTQAIQLRTSHQKR